MCDWTNRIATAQQTDDNCCGCQCACIPHELFIEPRSVCRQTYQSRAFYLHVNCVLIRWSPIEWTNACECCVFVYMRAVSLHFIFICVRLFICLLCDVVVALDYGLFDHEMNRSSSSEWHNRHRRQKHCITLNHSQLIQLWQQSSRVIFHNYSCRLWCCCGCCSYLKGQSICSAALFSFVFSLFNLRYGWVWPYLLQSMSWMENFEWSCRATI